jgi:5-methylcytosine-specific restriction protein A
MKRDRHALALIFMLVFPAVAKAQSWQLVTTQTDGTSWYIDGNSQSVSDGIATAWVKILGPSAQWLSTSSRYYLYTINRFTFNCKNFTFKLHAASYYSEDNNLVTSSPVDDTDFDSASAPPGTIANAILARVCSGETSQPSAGPLLSVGPRSTEVNWQLDGSSSAGSVYSTDYKMTLTQEGMAFFFEKTEFSSPIKDNSGRYVSYLYSIEEINCKNISYRDVMEDAYSTSGTYVSSINTAPKDIRFIDIVAGSPVDSERRRYCKSSQPTNETSDANSLSTGTAWIGPKGYLITANHVVAGASRVALAQDGNGSDIARRRCPSCGGGMEGFPVSLKDVIDVLLAQPRSIQRNPDWTRDELILALDAYFAVSSPDQHHPIVGELAAVLARYWAARGGSGTSTFRNASGVSMKLSNFQRLDPRYQERGRKGLAHGGRLEEEVWAEFSGDRARLTMTAKAIRDVVDQMPAVMGALGSAEPTIVDDVEAEEGAVLTRLHRIRERDPSIVKRRKFMAKASGRLACEACDFDFTERYGERGAGFIEAHHTKPLETLGPGSRTKMSDLALLCANCHRMIHARRPWLTIAELKALVRPWS